MGVQARPGQGFVGQYGVRWSGCLGPELLGGDGRQVHAQAGQFEEPVGEFVPGALALVGDVYGSRDLRAPTVWTIV